MTDTNRPTQLRLVLEVDDLDAALAFYRDVLGLPEQAAFSGEGGARVAILTVPSATLELANPAVVYPRSCVSGRVAVAASQSTPKPGRSVRSSSDSSSW